MLDNLTVIKQIIEDHVSIKKHVKLVGDSLGDYEAVSTLDKEYADLNPVQVQALSEKGEKLEQTFNMLGEGLRNHFAIEEKYLPSLLGEHLTRALLIEHREIENIIDRTKALVSGIKLEGLSREELISQKFAMQKTINDVGQMIEEHASEEEAVLSMLQKGLQ